MKKNFLRTVGYLLLLAVSLTLTQTEIWAQTKIIAHRGASGLAPENTLAAFQQALDIGVDMIELDVHLSQDDSLIVMHDNTVNRCSNGEGEIQNLRYAYIAGLDAGSWFNTQYQNERIPTLSQVLQLVNGKARVLIELKWPPEGIYKKLVEKVLQTIRTYQAESWVSIQSFETRYLEHIHKTAPDMDIQQLIVGRSQAFSVSVTRRLVWGEFIPQPGVSSVNPSVRFLNRKLVEEMHRQGLTVYPYTLNAPKKMRKALRMGVDGIITNRPDLAREQKP